VAPQVELPAPAQLRLLGRRTAGAENEQNGDERYYGYRSAHRAGPQSRDSSFLLCIAEPLHKQSPLTAISASFVLRTTVPLLLPL
jgi:hypothetical protein